MVIQAASAVERVRGLTVQICEELSRILEENQRLHLQLQRHQLHFGVLSDGEGGSSVLQNKMAKACETICTPIALDCTPPGCLKAIEASLAESNIEDKQPLGSVAGCSASVTLSPGSQFQGCYADPAKHNIVEGLLQSAQNQTFTSILPTTPIHVNETATSRKPVFTAAEEECMKCLIKNVMDNGTKTTQNEIYKTEGVAQQFVRSGKFEFASLGLIILNAIWLMIDADHNPEPMLINADVGFQVVENAFCFLFTFEWAFRLGAIKEKRRSWRDGWFVFDTIVVLMMVIEIWIVSIIAWIGTAHGHGTCNDSSFFSFIMCEPEILRVLRLARLTRLSRILRLMRQVPALLCIVKGMYYATKAVASTLLVLFIFVYAFAIVLKSWGIPYKYGKLYFPTVPEAIFTLVLNGTLLDNVTEVITGVRTESPVSAFVFALFILISALTMMNMLIGQVCNVMITVTEHDKELAVAEFLRANVQAVLLELDTNHDLTISLSEFKQIVTHPTAVKRLKCVGIDPVGLVDLASTIFQSDECGQQYQKQLKFDEFMEVLLQLRGGNPATVRDFVELRSFLMEENTKRNLHLAFIEEVLISISTFHDPTNRKLLE